LEIPGLHVEEVLRVENALLYQRYYLHRESLGNGGNEKWLWHGSAAVDSIIEDGFEKFYTNLDFNTLGDCFYAAIDLRLPDYIAKGTGVKPVPGELRQILLVRVAIGECIEKERILQGKPLVVDDPLSGPHTSEEWQKQQALCQQEGT